VSDIILAARRELRLDYLLLVEQRTAAGKNTPCACLPQEKFNMDFNTQPSGLVTPMLPPKLAPAGEPSDDMLVTEPVIGPAERSRPSTPNPMSVEAPGIDPGGSLVAELCWKVPKTAE
jgi:hypothetical protein